MIVDARETLQPIGLIEFKAPFVKGNGLTDYTAATSVADHAKGDLETLTRLNAVFPLVAGRLHLERSTTEITVFNPRQPEEAELDSSHIYAYSENGTLIVPWRMDILAVGSDVIVGYQADLQRSDNSYGYRVTNTAIAEFNNDSRGHKTPKHRTQISGLPVYLRLDSYDRGPYDGSPAIPRQVTVSSRGEKTKKFEVADGNMMHIEGLRQFVGGWSERWMVGQAGNNSRVRMVDIRLKGNWQ